MNKIARAIFPDKAKLFDQGRCTNCKKVVTDQPEFRDARTKKEYQFSGKCQLCQDEFFGK